jgi:predicted dehydrogenase
MDKVRFGVIGVGGMGTGHTEKMAGGGIEEVELTAVADVDPEALKIAMDKYGVRGFSNASELIKSGLVDAVVIATPHYFHPPIAIEAMKAGLHVVSEKPLAVQVSEADKMLKVAEETGQLLAVDFQLHASPEVQAARKLIDDGRVGEIYRTLLVEGRFRSQSYYDSATWRATWSGEGGGVLMNQAPHWMDIFCWLGGLPSKVYAKCVTRQHKIEVEDEGTAILEYPNGASGLLHESVNELPTSSRMEILGEKGKIVMEDGKLRFWEVPSGVKAFSDSAPNMWAKAEWQEVEVELIPREEGHGAIVRNMARAIMYGEPLLTPAADALDGLELIDAMMLSSDLGVPVDLPVDRAAFDDFIERMKAQSKGKKSVGPSQRITDPNL